MAHLHQLRSIPTYIQTLEWIWNERFFEFVGVNQQKTEFPFAVDCYSRLMLGVVPVQ